MQIPETAQHGIGATVDHHLHPNRPTVLTTSVTPQTDLVLSLSKTSSTSWIVTNGARFLVNKVYFATGLDHWSIGVSVIYFPFVPLLFW